MCEEDRRDTFCLHWKIDVYWFAIVFSISTIKIKTLIVDISYVWITIPFSIKSGWAVGTTIWFFTSMNQEMSPNMSLATHDQRAKWASKLALGNFDWLRLQHMKKGHGLTRLQIHKKTGKNWFIFSKRLHLFHKQSFIVTVKPQIKMWACFSRKLFVHRSNVGHAVALLGKFLRAIWAFEGLLPSVNSNMHFHWRRSWCHDRTIGTRILLVAYLDRILVKKLRCLDKCL